VRPRARHARHIRFRRSTLTRVRELLRSATVLSFLIPLGFLVATALSYLAWLGIDSASYQMSR
jgi:hypothetical protein